MNRPLFINLSMGDKVRTEAKQKEKNHGSF